MFYFLIIGFLWATSLETYENYLNSLKSLEGHFSQVAPDGGVSTGTIQLSRPGKLKITYDAPSVTKLYANGGWLVHEDEDGVGYIDLDSTPATFILREKFRFGGDLKVVNKITKDQVTRLTLQTESGQVTLVFEETKSRLALQQWEIIDAQNQKTIFRLTDYKTGVSFPSSLFTLPRAH